MGLAKGKEDGHLCRTSSMPSIAHCPLTAIHDVGVTVIPIVQIKNWKPKEVKKLVQGHTANM